MIPQLNFKQDLNSNVKFFLEELARTDFAGEIKTDFASQLVQSTDNSIYQILPQAVIFPRSGSDLVHLFQLANQEQFKSLTFSPRGGGTGTNGQSLSPGITLDCSKYMNQILEVNLEEGWVRVQPGVVLDQLNACLKGYGVCFAPTVASSSRATIGGMVNTDACGKGSRVYGRTNAHILELSWVLSDGTIVRSHPVATATLTKLKQQPGRLGDIYRQVDEIVTSKREQIFQTFPKMPRSLTGYNLAQVYSGDRDTFDLNKIIAGSEGTLAVVIEAKLKLTKVSKFKQLLVVRYGSFDDALKDSELLLSSEPTAIETVDEKILTLAKQDEIYERVKEFIADAQAINLVEFALDDLKQLQQKVGQLVEKIESTRHQSQSATGYYLTDKGEEIASLWELRKKGVGLLGNLKGKRQPIAFIEDTAVPPSSLASYVQELKALLTDYQLDYGMFGHVDVGCLHVRPALDLKAPEDEALIRELSNKVVALVKKYGGVMWGEHGKGFRSEYIPIFFGQELYEDLGKIKLAFDPDNKLNPGKIVTPFGSSAGVVRLEAPLRGHFERQVSDSLRSKYEVAFRCNGNGACFNFNPNDVMCPSAKATGDRIHSPKGRASLIREWLRQLETTKVENLEKPGSLPVKVWNTFSKFWGVYDYSHEVYEAIHGCLSCKACASQCPIHVDIPSIKAKFLQLYYTRYLRSIRDYLTGNVETLASSQSRFPILGNFVTDFPLTRQFLKQFIGLVDPPLASTLTVKQGLAERSAPKFDLTQLSALNRSQKANSVILLQDAFTSFYESQLFLDTYDLLNLLGYTVYVPPFFASGKTLHVQGFLPQFQAIAQKNARYLKQLGSLGIPIVGIEPSIVLTYRYEYVKILELEAPFVEVQLLQEFLAKHDRRLPSVANSKPYYLLGHCTEKTAALASVRQWQQVFQAVGLELVPLTAGCCGMSGIYGHETEHYALSKKIYQMSWGQHIGSNSEARERFLVTGYSCRSQVKRFEGWQPLHPVQVLRKHLSGINQFSEGEKRKLKPLSGRLGED